MIGSLSGEVWTSPGRCLLVKATIPGGPDPEPWKPGNQGLRPVEGLPRESIRTGAIGSGLDLTVPAYPNMAAGDVIGLAWGAETVEGAPLTAADVDRLVVVRIHASTVTGQGPGLVPIACQVREVVENLSDGWSAMEIVAVED